MLHESSLLDVQQEKKNKIADFFQFISFSRVTFNQLFRTTDKYKNVPHPACKGGDFVRGARCIYKYYFL